MTTTSFAYNDIPRLADIYILGNASISVGTAQEAPLTMLSETGGRAVGGILKAAQRIIIRLLTFATPYEGMEYGTDVAAVIRSGRSKDYVKETITKAVDTLNSQLRAADIDDTVPLDEQIDHIWLENISDTRTSISLTLGFVTYSGTATQIVLPLSREPGI